MAAVNGFKLEIKDDTCTGCGNCIVVCPVNAVEPQDVFGVNVGTVRVYDKEFCTGCGNCMQACAYSAIEVHAPRPEDIEEKKKVKDHLYGIKGEIYELIKQSGPLTITDIAKEMGISVREASANVFMLKTSDKIHEYEKIDGKYAYSTEKAKKEAQAAKEEARPSIPPEVARKIKERLDKTIETFNTLKVRLLVETDKLDKAKAELIKGGKPND